MPQTAPKTDVRQGIIWPGVVWVGWGIGKGWEKDSPEMRRVGELADVRRRMEIRYYTEIPCRSLDLQRVSNHQPRLPQDGLGANIISHGILRTRDCVLKRIDQAKSIWSNPELLTGANFQTIADP
jgi:hypothetical protein